MTTKVVTGRKRRATTSLGRRVASVAGSRHGVADLAAGAAVLLVAAGFVAYAAAHTGRGGGDGVRFVAQFENIGSLSTGSEVRVGGVKVGAVTGTAIDVKTYQAIVMLTVQRDLALSNDTSATISSSGLLGGAFLSLSPGGSETMLHDGDAITVTQSASNFEDLLGKFIFNVGNLADATQKSLQKKAASEP